MIIRYEQNRDIREEYEFEIEDIENVFLTGVNIFGRGISYFGIWHTDKGLAIVEISNGERIKYYHSMFTTPLYADQHIQKYLEAHKNVQIISKSKFVEQIQHIKSILEI